MKPTKPTAPKRTKTKYVATVVVETDRPTTKRALREWMKATIYQGFDDSLFNDNGGEIGKVSAARVRSVDID